MAVWSYKVRLDPRQHPPRDWVYVILRNGEAVQISDRFSTAKDAGAAARRVFEEAKA